MFGEGGKQLKNSYFIFVTYSESLTIVNRAISPESKCYKSSNILKKSFLSKLRKPYCRRKKTNKTTPFSFSDMYLNWSHEKPLFYRIDINLFTTILETNINGLLPGRWQGVSSNPLCEKIAHSTKISRNQERFQNEIFSTFFLWMVNLLSYSKEL